MKKFVLSAVGLCIAYFILGRIAVQFNWLSSNEYNSYGVIVGGLASLLGLLAYALPSSTAATDLRSVEVQTLRDISLTIEGRKNQAEAATATDEQRTAFELQKAEMEALVRKASLVLFLRDQLSRHEAYIIPIIKNHPELEDRLAEIESLQQELSDLEEEVKLDENVNMLNEIIERESMKDRYASLETWEKYLLISLKALFQIGSSMLFRSGKKRLR